MSRAARLRHMRAGHKVPDLNPSPRIMPMVQYFNDARSFAGVIDNPMTMDVIEGWQRHTGVKLERWERDCLFAMDRALRRGYSDVLKYHAEWDAGRAKAKKKV